VLGLRLLPFGSDASWSAVRARLTSWTVIRAYLLALGLILGGAYLLYLPFHTWFYSFIPGGTGPVTTPTDPRLFFTLFGIWLFLLAAFFTVELRDRLERRSAARGDAPATPTLRLRALAIGSPL